MGKKGSWLYALSCGRPKSNEKKNKKLQITQKSKGLFRRQKNRELDSSDEPKIESIVTLPSPKPIEELIGPEIEDVADGYSMVDANNMDEAKAHSAGNDTDDGDKYSVIEGKNENERNDHSARNDRDDGDVYEVEAKNKNARNDHFDENENARSDQFVENDIEDRDENSVLGEENEDALSAHLDEKDAKDGDKNSVVEKENEDALSSHLATKGGDEDFVVEAENEDATNVNSTDKGKENGDEFSMVEVENEDATNAHSADKDTKDMDEYSVAEVDNKDAMNVNSAGKDTQDGDEYSMVETGNKDATNAYSVDKDTCVGDEYSVVDPETEDATNAHYADKDTKSGDEYSVVDPENEDATNASSVDKDTKAGDEYSVVEANIENATNSHSPSKDTEDGDECSVVEAENENARNAHSADNDTEVVGGYIEVEAENEDARNENFEENDLEDDHDMHADSIASPSVAAEEVVVAAEAVSENVQLSTAAHAPVKSKEEIAALKIQSLFRGYMARRSFWAVKGLMRLKTLVRGQPVKRQATTTLRCMQAMARVQKQVGAKRIRMSEENQALHRQLQQKHYIDKLIQRKGGHWDDSPRTKEQIEEQRRRQQLAIIRRERELAYAYSHEQTWKNSPKQATQTSMDPHNPQWGWNWLEKWMATRPWENKTIEELNSEPPSAKSVTALAQKVRRDLKLDQVKSPPKKQTHTPGRLSSSSHQTTTPKSASTGRVRVPKSSGRSVLDVDDDDARSVHSQRPEPHRRHSGTGPSTRNVDSQESLATTPSFMSPTVSAKAKLRLSIEKNGSPEKVS